MARGFLSVHAHFYQPDRRDPWFLADPIDASAAPDRDWNTRIDRECYAPNAAEGNFGRVGFDLGPTLARWLAVADPTTHARIAAQAGGGISQSFHHTILPLASAAERRTEIRWGLRDFELRFGRRATGLWLPECAVDMPTLRAAADEGVTFTILAPWQAAWPIDVTRPYRVDLGAGRAMIVVFYDAEMSARLSFDPSMTSDADAFAAREVAPRVGGEYDVPRVLLVATDGELYGHHQPFRDRFLQRLTEIATSGSFGFGGAPLGDLLAGIDPLTLDRVEIAERTSWSCHHGIARWTDACSCAGNGGWKRFLRIALERLAAGADAACEREARSLGLNLWTLRDAYADVASGFVDHDTFVVWALRTGGRSATPAETLALSSILFAQASRLAMFTSCAWFWDDPSRPETIQVLRHAALVVRLLDDLTAGHLGERLVEDLDAVRSSNGMRGPALLSLAVRDWTE
jgi:hypothetical protein